MNIKKLLFSLFIFFSLSFFNVFPIYSQSCYNYTIDTLIQRITIPTVSKIVHELTGDTSCIVGGNSVTISTRAYNYPGNDVAAQYIYERLQSFGLTASYWTFSSTGKNVIGRKLGTKYPNQKFIVCSHYDSYPWQARSIGADDNATGTAVVLEAARLLSLIPFDYTLEFITFDEEERGLFGSHAYADSSISHGDSIVCVLNFDMIAYDANKDAKTRIYTNNPSIYYANVASSAMNIYIPTLDPTITVNPNMSSSDHYYFWQDGFKALWPFEYDVNPYVNSMQDTISRFNFKYFVYMTKAAVAFFATLGKDYLMDYYHTPIVSSDDTSSQLTYVVIKSKKPLATGLYSPKLYYKVNNGFYSPINSYYNNLDTFKFSIPGQQGGATVSYYFAAQDVDGLMMGSLPAGAKGISPPGTVPPKSVFAYSIITGIAENSTPVKYALEQNYPNPFNPETIISFSLSKSTKVRLIVYDMLGREVDELMNDNLNVGSHEVSFNGLNLSSGVYYYTMFLDGFKFDTKKMVLIK